MEKDPKKRITIKELLEHPWLQIYHKSNYAEIRQKSRILNESIFEVYSTFDEENNKTKK